MPSAPEPSPAGGVRPPRFRSRTTHDSQPDISRHEARRLAMLAVVAVQGVILTGTWAAHVGPRRLLLAPLAALAVLGWATYHFLRPLDGDAPRRRTARTCGCICAVLFAAACAAAARWSPGQIALSVLTPGLTLAIAFGLYLLVRQWTRRQITYALLPILVPAVLPSLSGAGNLLHLYYATEFGIATDDVQVSSTARAFASLTVFAIFAAVTLAVLARWRGGYPTATTASARSRRACVR